MIRLIVVTKTALNNLNSHEKALLIIELSFYEKNKIKIYSFAPHYN